MREWGPFDSKTTVRTAVCFYPLSYHKWACGWKQQQLFKLHAASFVKSATITTLQAEYKWTECYCIPFQKTHKHTRKTAFHCVNIKKINKYQPLCGLQHLSKCVSPSVTVPCLCVCLYVCIPRIFFRLSSPKTHLLLSLKLYLQGCVVYTDVCLISVLSSYLLYLCEPVCVVDVPHRKKTHVLMHHCIWFTDDMMFTLPELVWLH